MKILNTFNILFLVFFFTTCKAQQFYPLETWPQDVAAGSYIKDFNNELDSFIGVWKVSYNGSNYFLNISKEINHPIKTPNNTYVYKDALIIKYEVKTLDNILMIHSNNNSTYDTKDYIFSFALRSPNQAIFYYTGVRCDVGRGKIIIKKISNNEIEWSYASENTLLTENSCPGNQDLTIFLPKSNSLIFTKQ